MRRSSLKWGLASTLSMLAASASAAPPVMYDENNSGNLNAVTPVGLLDLSEGNFVMVQPGALTAGDIGATFLMRFQSRLDGAIFDDGSLGFTFPGEVTVEFVVPLEFVGISGTRREFALDASVLAGPGNYFDLYHDSTFPFGDSSITAGTGFTNGTHILAASFFDVYFSVDTADLPGTFLAALNIASFAPTAFDVPGGYTARLDGAVFIPGQLPSAALIAGYAPVSGDILGSVDFTMTFVPETNTVVLVALGAVAAVGFLRRRLVG